MKKTYFITMQKNHAGIIMQKTFFHHKPFFWTRKDMIDEIISLYPDYSFVDIKRIS